MLLLVPGLFFFFFRIVAKAVIKDFMTIYRKTLSFQAPLLTRYVILRTISSKSEAITNDSIQKPNSQQIRF